MNAEREFRVVSVVLVLAVSLLSSCRPGPTPPTVTPSPTPVEPTAPAHETALAFLQSWASGEYRDMYALVSSETRASTPYEEFERIYREVAEEATILAVHPTVRAVLEDGLQAQVVFRVEVETSFVGSFSVENELSMVWEQGGIGRNSDSAPNHWGVEWSKQSIFPQLAGENLVHMVPRSPARANIYDAKGRGLAIEGDLVTVGVVPRDIEDEAALLARLSLVLDMPQPEIRAKYQDQPPTWFIPIADISVEESRKQYELLSTEPGISLREKSVRVYRTPAAAPHVIGFLGKIPAEELVEWQARGYVGDELIGRAGMEAWGESYLAGQRGGVLTIITPEGQVAATLGRRDAIPARSIHLTLDYDFQRTVEDLLGERKGSVVVLDVNDGRVLALATWPRFDPSLFAEGIDPTAWSALINDPANPLMNRPIQGQYASGSTFKIVTMGTIMERGGVKPTQTYNCPGSWDKLGWPMTCWLRSGHGTIDLVTALTASCDVTFYQVGYDLSFIDRDALPSYARAFGFGTPTGIGAPIGGSASGEGSMAASAAGGDPLGEASGLVPDDAWKRRVWGDGWATGDNVNLAIGQGFLLVTPLQMARMVAAVGNGGTLYRPQLVSKIAGSDQEPEIVVKPERVGRLPVTPETLAAIRKGMEGVTTSPQGTATHRFQGFPIPVAGKTGTAQNEGELPHAWFVGYLPADQPEIAIVVMVENVGEGSTYAAPLFRQVAAAYYGLEEETTAVIPAE
jgi:penicillin-binding protein 2